MGGIQHLRGFLTRRFQVETSRHARESSFKAVLICQGLQDMAYLAGGPIYREIVGILYVVG